MNEKTVKHLLSIFNNEQLPHVLQGTYDELVKITLLEQTDEIRNAAIKTAQIILLIKEEIARRS